VLHIYLFHVKLYTDNFTHDIIPIYIKIDLGKPANENHPELFDIFITIVVEIEIKFMMLKLKSVDPITTTIQICKYLCLTLNNSNI